MNSAVRQDSVALMEVFQLVYVFNRVCAHFEGRVQDFGTGQQVGGVVSELRVRIRVPQITPLWELSELL